MAERRLIIDYYFLLIDMRIYTLFQIYFPLFQVRGFFALAYTKIIAKNFFRLTYSDFSAALHIGLIIHGFAGMMPGSRDAYRFIISPSYIKETLH